MSKEEKKAAAEEKRAEIATKKAAKKAAELEARGEDVPEEVLEVLEASKDPDKGKKKKKEEEVVEEEGDSLESGTHKLAVVTAVLASRKDAKDIKVGVRGGVDGR
jgi:hypothetical protein